MLTGVVPIAGAAIVSGTGAKIGAPSSATGNVGAWLNSCATFTGIGASATNGGNALCGGGVRGA